jgi:predicted kinase
MESIPLPALVLPRLLRGTSMCYKPNMRKWMRDRVKGRRKPSEKKAEATQAPLQPAYFDAGTPAAEAPAAPVEVSEPAHAAASASEPEAIEAQPSGNAAPTGPKRRRRRGRGGRGRSRSSSATPAAAETPAPAAAALEAPPAGDPQATAPAAARAPKGVVVLAVGLPGSGKSSWFKRHNLTPLSSDLLRSLLFDDPTEQRFQDLVFSNLRSMLKARLIARRPVNYVDATNLTSHDRHSWIKLAKDFGYEVQAVFFDVPLEVCLERNQKRERVVAEDVVRRLASKMKQPTFEEGFSKITVVRVKPKQDTGAVAQPVG